MIDYYLGKTAGVRGYTLYRNGENEEGFYDNEGDCSHFSSAINPEHEGKVWDSDLFVDEFFRSQDALDAGIMFTYFLQTSVRYGGVWAPGQTRTIRNLGFALSVGNHAVAITRPPFEHVDLLTTIVKQQ